MQDRMTEVFSSGSVVLLQDRAVLTRPMHPFSPYSRIQIGIEIVVDNGTQTES